MAKKADFNALLTEELKNRPEQETFYEEDKPSVGFKIPKKEVKPPSQAKNNFPFYIEKPGADKLLDLARQSGMTRNELLIAMVNKCLGDLDLKWRVK